MLIPLSGCVKCCKNCVSTIDLLGLKKSDEFLIKFLCPNMIPNQFGTCPKGNRVLMYNFDFIITDIRDNYQELKYLLYGIYDIEKLHLFQNVVNT